MKKEREGRAVVARRVIKETAAAADGNDDDGHAHPVSRSLAHTNVKVVG